MTKVETLNPTNGRKNLYLVKLRNHFQDPSNISGMTIHHHLGRWQWSHRNLLFQNHALLISNLTTCSLVNEETILITRAVSRTPPTRHSVIVQVLLAASHAKSMQPLPLGIRPCSQDTERDSTAMPATKYIGPDWQQTSPKSWGLAVQNYYEFSITV